MWQRAPAAACDVAPLLCCGCHGDDAALLVAPPPETGAQGSLRMAGLEADLVAVIEWETTKY